MGPSSSCRCYFVGAILFIFGSPTYSASGHTDDRAGVLLTSDAGKALCCEAQRDDLITHWAREASPNCPKRAAGPIDSPFELLRILIDQAPCGELELRGFRSGAPVTLSIPTSGVILRSRPLLTDAEQALIQNAIHAAVSSLERAMLDTLVEELVSTSRIEEGAWVYRQAAEVANRTGDLDAEISFLRDAVGIVAGISPRAEAILRLDLSKNLSRARRLDELQLEQADQLAAQASLGELFAAEIRFRIGRMKNRQGDWLKAEEILEKVLITSRLRAPNSLALARYLHELGAAKYALTDLDEAESLLREALELKKRLRPDTIYVASALTILGVVHRGKGELDRADELYDAASILCTRIKNEECAQAASHNRGVIAALRLDFESAEYFFREARRLAMMLWGQDAIEVASLDANLGTLLVDRFRASLHEEDASEFLMKAEEHLRAADAIYAGISRHANRLAVRANLVDVLLLRNVADEALALARGNLELARELKGSMYEAEAWGRLGDAQAANGLHAEAVESLTVAHSMMRERLVTSYRVALPLFRLAQLQRESGALGEASRRLYEALEIIEREQLRIEPTANAVARFRAKFAPVYQELIEVLVESGLPEQAFIVSERGRGVALRSALAESSIDRYQYVPGKLLERESRLKTSISSKLERLLTLPKVREHERLALVREVDDLLASLDRVSRKVGRSLRRNAPELAALRYPRPLKVSQLRKSLPAGLAMVSYAVGKESTIIFILSDGALRFEVSPIGAAELHRVIARMLRLIENTRSRSKWERARFEALSRDLSGLFEMLVLPVMKHVNSQDDLVIIPDGPLAVVPWQALMHRTPEGSSYLVESRAVSTVPSLSTYAELARRAAHLRNKYRDGWPVEMVAVGEATCPLAVQAAEEVGRVGHLGRGLTSRFDCKELLASRLEVESIAELDPSASVVLRRGAAREEQIKALKVTRRLHLATHAFVDPMRPSTSMILLSGQTPGAASVDNGLLTVREIEDEVRLDSELVVLSSCDSARGQMIQGEGPMGLSRAFHIAGAPAVVASLWKIDDSVTADLMVIFHRRLKSGEAPNQALRGAQLEILRKGREAIETGESSGQIDLSAPYSWAAFQLSGAW